VAPPPPLPPPRPSNEALGLQPPQVDTPTISAPPLSTPPILRKQDLPGFGTPDGQGRNFGTPNVGARPSLTPPSLAPQPAKPSGIMASPPPVDPDRMERDQPAPAWQNPPGLLGPGMGGPNPPWQDPPKPTTVQNPLTPQPSAGDSFARLTKDMSALSGILGDTSMAMTPAKKLSGPSPSRPLIDSQPLLTGGLLSQARQGIDLNRFFGLLSGRVI
jgi:hypothetical protein